MGQSRRRNAPAPGRSRTQPGGRASPPRARCESQCPRPARLDPAASRRRLDRRQRHQRHRCDSVGRGAAGPWGRCRRAGQARPNASRRRACPGDPHAGRQSTGARPSATQAHFVMFARLTVPGALQRRAHAVSSHAVCRTPFVARRLSHAVCRTPFVARRLSHAVSSHAHRHPRQWCHEASMHCLARRNHPRPQTVAQDRQESLARLHRVPAELLERGEHSHE